MPKMTDDEKNRKYPTIRVNNAARDHARKVVKAMQANGITTASMASVISQAILDIPVPEPKKAGE